MSTDFSSIRNHIERPVFEAVLAAHSRYPGVDASLLPDVACVALNRLPPRYIRHAVDLAFYQSEKERTDNERAVLDIVNYAFEFVQARVAMRAR
ncbi:MAG: late competence development ComFB family protein [Methylibium sp.]|uniref:late competence development ComFB family protein n=1 Tax=Methylibium sp. TaxID=2067992 RepID=UPI00181ED77A|nr:late competence development ComFB family protein [Methylibium sp.]MBA3597870.1 late competence development ComFB family protein [Methylibium sp.]